MAWLWIWLTVFSAWAQPSKEGYIYLTLSPDTEIVRFESSRPAEVELGIYHNREPIVEQLDKASARWFSGGHAYSVGGGIWFMTLLLEEPDVAVTWEKKGGITKFVFKRQAKALPPPKPPESTLKELIGGSIPRRPARPPAIALHPLWGDANTLTEPPISLLPISLESKSSHRIIDALRLELTQTKDPDEKQRIHLGLGLNHLDMGLPREALYYLGMVEGEPGPVSAAQAQLYLARANMAAKRWDTARDHCRAAYQRGAPDRDVAVCLGIVSQVTSSPPPTETARFLLNDDRPEVQLLAAELLQRDNRHAESLKILEDLKDKLKGGDQQRVYASLGDARFAVSQLEEARHAWHQGGHKGERGRILRLRRRMAVVWSKGPQAWTAWLPELEFLALEGSPVSAEARYLAVQIANILGDDEVAAEHLGSLWDRFPHLALHSDIGEQLVETCQKRLVALEEEKRYAEQVVFFSNCWRVELDQMVGQPDTILAAAAAFEQLNLMDRALRLHQRALVIHTRSNPDDPVLLLKLAKLHHATKRPREALDTIAYLRKLKLTPAIRKQIDHLEADVHHQLGDRKKAAALYKQSGDLIRWALLEAAADNCKEAVPVLQPLKLDTTPPPLLAPEIRLALARCFVDSDPQLAMAYAQAQSEDEEATWLSVRALLNGATPPEGDLSEPLADYVREEQIHASRNE